ncbi:MAG TPA: phosphate butyryltransferase [bacterium (Candidatus Stahlbacteria)]|nr:phosphate butyryltransferase [Candidatus Stahlbacteria bacterium]
MKTFEEVCAFAKKKGPKRCVVAGGDDTLTIKALRLAREQGICKPVLVGNFQKIEQAIKDSAIKGLNFDIIDGEPASRAVQEVKENGDFLLKGKIPTPDFLRAILAPEGLRTDRILSHTAILEIPGYHKLVFVTDGGMNVNPDLDTKIQIIKNSIELARQLGIHNPKVAILAASEEVNPKIPASIDAQELTNMNSRGKFPGTDIRGPLSLDLALSRDAARKKGFEGPVYGNADILVVPDVATGNIFAKGLIYFANTQAAGIILGASKPVVMLSRADPPRMKVLTIALGVAVS